VYLVEAKYHRRPATIDHVDSLFTRLERHLPTSSASSVATPVSPTL
jgi:hypothetical protein